MLATYNMLHCWCPAQVIAGFIHDQSADVAAAAGVTLETTVDRQSVSRAFTLRLL